MELGGVAFTVLLSMFKQQESGLKKPSAKSADELKERIKQSRSLETMSKEETLKLRMKHVG